MSGQTAGDAVAALLFSKSGKSQSAQEQHRVSPEQKPPPGREDPAVCQETTFSAASKQQCSQET